MTEPRNERFLVRAVLTFAGIAAFFTAPLLPFANLGLLSLVGIGMGLVAGGLWLDVGAGEKRAFDWSSVGVAVIGTGLTYFLIVAAADYRRNEARCATLQRDMLSAQPRRPDSAALFQALGCHAHGSDPVDMPKQLPTVTSQPIGSVRRLPSPTAVPQP